MVELMVTFSKRAYSTLKSAAPRAPACPWGRPLLTCASGRYTQTLKGRSGSISVVSPGVHKVLFEPFEHLCWYGV